MKQKATAPAPKKKPQATVPAVSHTKPSSSQYVPRQLHSPCRAYELSSLCLGIVALPSVQSHIELLPVPTVFRLQPTICLAGLVEPLPVRACCEAYSRHIDDTTGAQHTPVGQLGKTEKTRATALCPFCSEALSQSRVIHIATHIPTSPFYLQYRKKVDRVQHRG